MPCQGTRRRWPASLELAFQRRAGRTVVGRRRHSGPLMVQSPFYPEGAPCHVYVLHPPGGLVGGDSLALSVQCEPRSHALITTPAAGKVYRSSGDAVVVQQDLRVAAGATLEWLPAECIVFDGAHCRLGTRVELEAGARLLAWEAFILGRPACGESFTRGSFRQALELRVDGRPLLLERNHALGGSPWLREPWGLGGDPAAATLLAYPGDSASRDAALAQCSADPGADRAAVTLVDGLLVCRVLAAGLAPLRARLERLWRALRPGLAGREAVAPRIWAT